MRVLIFGFILLKVMKLIAGTCVLESEFGFILNCNFKKSGLFRVRNLGGLKAHFGLGFSLGDELGFGESLGNLEGNRRRALNYKTGFINKVGIVSPPKTDASTISQSQINHMRNFNQNTSSMTEVMFLPLGVPTFRPIPKNPNNLVRRNDVILSNGLSNNNRMTDFYYKAEKGTANTTNLSAGVDTGSSFIEENKTYNTLNNISNSIYNENVESYKTAPVTKTLNSTPGRSSKVLVVMNAPKEYYPSGYDKNFDDNFKSKVDLPPTDFACADQKYFPGLYANIDLGCMVFHVCAITDGGIIMKSFLCPESTLFDQSILKCNWWFYVDCNNSIYDSNIPISKSYQLMKSLSYFSNFTKMHTLDKEAS